MKNFKKINEDFLDNQEVDIIQQDDEMELDNFVEFNYLLRFDYKDDASATELGRLLNNIITKFPEIEEHIYFKKVNEVSLQYQSFTFNQHFNQDELINAFAFNADFKSPYSAMRFVIAICKIAEDIKKKNSVIVENCDGEDCEINCDKFLKSLKTKEIYSLPIATLYRAVHVLLDDYDEFRKTDRALMMTLDYFDAIQAIVNNYPGFYLQNESKVVLCENVQELDGLKFDLEAYADRDKEITNPTMLYIDDHAVAGAAKSLYPNFAGRLFSPNAYNPNASTNDVFTDISKRKTAIKNAQINIINHPGFGRHYVSLIFCAFIGLAHYSNMEPHEDADHAQLVFATLKAQVTAASITESVDDFIDAISNAIKGKMLIDKKQLSQKLQNAIVRAWI